MPADPAPTALDALLAEVEGASKWMTHATRDYLARTAAPRLAAIVRVLRAALVDLEAAETTTEMRAIKRHDLARAEAIARGEE